MWKKEETMTKVLTVFLLLWFAGVAVLEDDGDGIWQLVRVSHVVGDGGRLMVHRLGGHRLVVGEGRGGGLVLAHRLGL